MQRTLPTRMRHTVYLGLGTNLGDKADNIGRAIKEIEELVGKTTRRSALYDTAPWGFQSENRFLNAVIAVETTLSPREVLLHTQEIEKQMGRMEKSKDAVYSDRIIDIDLLIFDDLHINEPDLVVPHPLMAEREFVMKPLAEIADIHEIERIIQRTSEQ